MHFKSFTLKTGCLESGACGKRHDVFLNRLDMKITQSRFFECLQKKRLRVRGLDERLWLTFSRFIVFERKSYKTVVFIS